MVGTPTRQWCCAHFRGVTYKIARILGLAEAPIPLAGCHKLETELVEGRIRRWDAVPALPKSTGCTPNVKASGLYVVGVTYTIASRMRLIYAPNPLPQYRTTLCSRANSVL